MEKFDLKKEKIPFTQIANSVLVNPKLSAKAKGIYAYLYSKPESWNFSYVRMAQDFKDSKNAILGGIQELEENGFLIRSRQGDGRVLYQLFITPHSEPNTEIRSEGIDEPMTQKASDPNQVRPDLGHISNKDIKVIKNNTSNKESTALAESKPKEISLRENTADFFNSTSRQNSLSQAIADKYGADVNFIKQEMHKFVLYWTEPLQSGRKVRWETEKAFEIQRRLATWFGRVKTFNKTITPIKRERKIWK